MITTTYQENQIKIKLAEKMHPQNGEFFVIRGYNGNIDFDKEFKIQECKAIFKAGHYSFKG